ncbi:hypothetical protein K458DRAFT_417143 [Lentithecium fluviatile CBS 122367]|uniref:CENP-V/GFA domain-containing protein n=1 Tax=Lentithecium fluviatile CBS 122367 TaxID=1168545 RepID=A0A6G1J3F2_9PLEO|nr:hypothetical protein K458DRAFT_417143 [Lentithecium fluviatile CBS 122367]
MEDAKQLTVACLCGAASHTFSVPASAFPLPTHLCSCNISRRISGSLLTSYVNITHGVDPPKPDLSALTPYKSSDILTRHFCSTCGTQMYLEYNHDGHFEAATGTLQVDSTDNVVEHKAHIWIEDTRDGGATHFIAHVGDRDLKRYLQGPGKSEEASLDWTLPRPIDTTEIKQTPIHAHCHCGGVQFYIHSPNEASRTAESSFPDLLIPYHTGSSENPENEPWWLPSPTRFLAGTCACTSCRRASGFDVTFWAFIPAVNIFLDENGTQIFTRNPYWGSMKTFRSSQNVTRTFCGTCGANIFWDGDERPSIVDVAVGLLDAKSGARAEDLLAWWPGRVSFEEEALNKGLINGLGIGLKEWARRNDGNECIATKRLT